MLAGGKGTRLKSVITDLPNEAPIGKKPFLEYVFRSLKKCITRVILSVCYK